MPQASPQVRAEYSKHFGEQAFDEEAYEYLTKEVGLKCKRGQFFWVTDAMWDNNKTRIALIYLADEWDYGWYHEWDYGWYHKKYDPGAKIMRPTIDETMLEIAHVLAKRGTCLKKQVGAVVTDINGIILSTGYNGQPRKDVHCEPLTPCPAYLDATLSCKAIHAETNALLRCPDIEKAAIIYITEAPCEKCRLMIRNTGIQLIVYSDEYGNKIQEPL